MYCYNKDVSQGRNKPLREENSPAHCQKFTPTHICTLLFVGNKLYLTSHNAIVQFAYVHQRDTQLIVVGQAQPSWSDFCRNLSPFTEELAPSDWTVGAARDLLEAKLGNPTCGWLMSSAYNAKASAVAEVEARRSTANFHALPTSPGLSKTPFATLSRKQ